MPSKQEIILFLKGKKNASFLELAKAFSIRRDQNRSFSNYLFGLVKTGSISKNFEGKYYIIEQVKTAQGVIRLSAKGFGFVQVTDEEDSYFVPANKVNTAMNGDEVKVAVFHDTKREGGFIAHVIEVLARKRQALVGKVISDGKFLTLKPFDSRLYATNFRFTNTQDLKENLEVKVKIIKHKRGHVLVEVVKIFGDADDISMDILAAIEDSGVPYVFAPSTIDEAHKIPATIDEESKEGRTDFRKKLIVTIDGDDTKDFDDAIEVEKLTNGNYLLSVHIADVTHYVKESNPLDDEAKERGTSIYLADRVIPMLPVELSNGICSLNPNEDRFVISCLMEISPAGKTVKHSIVPGIIRSKYRLTYKEVNKFYEK